MTDNKRLYWLGGDQASKQDTFFLEALDDTLWSAGTEDNWDACWHTSMPDQALFEQLTADKTINHIPGNSALTIKRNLHSTLTQAKQRVLGLPQEQRYDFYPQTYSMPEDYFAFQAAAKQNPDMMWIQKPKNLSRGRGIEVVNHPESVPLSNEWIVQRYLSSPHLWDGYKYVLRCYVLITSIEPLRFYWYHEGFAKLTSEPYSTEDLDNPYRHLTNPDINEDNEEVDVPVTFYSFKRYREWLQSEGIDDKKLFAELEDLIGLSVIAARENMRTQSQKITADTTGTYELIGLDCMVDSDFKPWILECNLSPSLDTYSSNDSGSDEETNIKRELVADLVNILGLNETNSEHHLNAQQKAAAERQRAGGFQCVFPSEQANDYLHCFPLPRYQDIASLPDVVKVDYSKLPLHSKPGVEAVFPDSLALLSSGNHQQAAHYIYPNELATWIWLQNSAGLLPEDIAQQLVAAVNTDTSETIDNKELEQQYLQQVWEVLADWGQANLLTQQDQQSAQNTTSTVASAVSNTTSSIDTPWLATRYINLAGITVALRCACTLAAQYLEPLTTAEAVGDPTMRLDILRSNYGYVMINDHHVVAGSRRLSQLFPECLRLVESHCLQHDDVAVVTGVVLSIQDKNILFLRESTEHLDNVAYAVLKHVPDCKLVSSSSIMTATAGTARSTDLPLSLPGKIANQSQAKPQHSFNATDQSVTKTPWVIAEQAEQLTWLATANTHSNQAITIDAVVSTQVLSDKTDNITALPRLQALSSAETVAVLWDQCLTGLVRADAKARLYQDNWQCTAHSRQQIVAQKLPTWLENIQGLQLNITADTVLAELPKVLLPELASL